jgi:hypothetical protein
VIAARGLAPCGFLCASTSTGRKPGGNKKHRAQAWWLRHRRALRQPAGLRPAAFCVRQKAPGASLVAPKSTGRKPGGCGIVGRCASPRACAQRLFVCVKKHRARALPPQSTGREPGGCGGVRPSACEFRHVPDAGCADGVIHRVGGEVGTIWPADASVDSRRLCECGRVA